MPINRRAQPASSALSPAEDGTLSHSARPEAPVRGEGRVRRCLPALLLVPVLLGAVWGSWEGAGQVPWLSTHDEADLWLHQAQTSAARAEWSTALESARKAGALAPDEPAPLILEGYALLRLGEPAAAAEVLSTVRTRHPDADPAEAGLAEARAEVARLEASGL